MEFKSDVLGLALLGSISAFSIWSAANPSVFTISQFTTEKSKENARLGMNIGLGLCGALSAGLYLAYGKKGTMPAVLTGATGVGLYALYDYMLSNSHLSNPEKKTMPEQFEAMQAGGGGQSMKMPMTPDEIMCADNPIGWPQDPMCQGSNQGMQGQWDDRGIQYPTETYPSGEPGQGGGGGPGGGGGGPQGLPGRSGYGTDDWPDWMKNLPEGTTTYPGQPGLPGGGGGASGGPIGGGGGVGQGGHPQLPEGTPNRGSERQDWTSGGGFPQQGFYDAYGNFYMSKAQVKASGWPQCQGCLKHGRTLRDCSMLGECRGPWSDGSTPDDLKMKQLRLSGLGGYGDSGDYGYDVVSYHAGSYPHGGRPHPVMASPASNYKYHVDEGYSDYRGYR